MAREMCEVREAASIVEAADVKDSPRPGIRASAAEPRIGKSCTRLEKDMLIWLCDDGPIEAEVGRRNC